MDSVLGIGLRGLKNGFERLSDASSRITSAFRPESTEDPVKGIIDQKTADIQIKASAEVIKTAEELDKSILDIIA